MMDWRALAARPSALEFYQISPKTTSGLAGLTAGQDLHPALKIK
jgi:hypothetical protein